MEYLPIFVAAEKRPVLVIGGGSIANRKIQLLLRTGAAIRVVSPTLCDPLKALHESGKIEWINRNFLDQDLDDVWLVYTASDDPFLQKHVAREAEARRILVNTVDDRGQCSFIMPAIVDRSPVMVAISSGGASPVLARRIRDAVEKALPHSLSRLAQLVAGLRHDIAKRITDFSHRRRFHEWLVDGPVADSVNRGKDSDARQQAMDALEKGQWDKQGRVYLLGAGPGDPELLTLKASRLLQEADVVVHDGLVDSRVLELARRDAEFIDVSKKAGHHRMPQEKINALLGDMAEEGQIVARLKGGDPFVFGRGGEELEHLRARGVAYEVVPGITAAVGCAAYAGIPLTHRDHAQSVCLVTAHCRESVDTLDWNDLAHSRQTLAFYMAVRQAGRVQRQLIRHGRSSQTPIALVENGCRPEQRIIVGTLAELATLVKAHQLQSPALIYVGEVARFAQALAWYGQAPISGASPLPYLSQAI